MGPARALPRLASSPPPATGISLAHWLEAAHAALGRRSRARVAVMTAIGAQAGAFSLETLRAAHPASRATLFRVLRALLDRNLLCEVPAIDGGVSYRINLGDEHHHLVCLACGNVTDANLGDLNAALAEAARAAGFDPLSHRVDVFGRCASCAVSAEERAAAPAAASPA